MHLDKKLITIIVSSALIGGIIGGGIGGAIGSFASQEEGSSERRGNERMMGWNNNSYYGDVNEGEENSVPQRLQVSNPTQVPVVTASTTKAK
jgi:hypothetical protein